MWRAVRGVCSAGLMTTVFPQLRAGAIFHMNISRGKFHWHTREKAYSFSAAGSHLKDSMQFKLIQLAKVFYRNPEDFSRKKPCTGPGSNWGTTSIKARWVEEEEEKEKEQTYL